MKAAGAPRVLLCAKEVSAVEDVRRLLVQEGYVVGDQAFDGAEASNLQAQQLVVLDSSHAVYIERVQAGLVRLGVNVRLGSRIPAYCTALGHSILAYLPFEQRVEILNLQQRVKLTARTPVTIPEIEERLEQVRRIGYALSDQDTVAGLRVLAGRAGQRREARLWDCGGGPLTARMEYTATSFAEPYRCIGTMSIICAATRSGSVA